MVGDSDVLQHEVCALSAVRRVAAMLDLDPDSFGDGDPLPFGWHFPMMAAQTRRSDLRSDGFPGLGVVMPDLGLPRLLLARRAVDQLAAIPIGAAVERCSAVADIAHKDDARGRRALVSIRHELRVDGAAAPSIAEVQTYMLLPAGPASAGERMPQVIEGEKTKTLVPDATMLFQYSALGFNSHRIHIDRAFARDVEGFPDLVVNGGLTTLLLTEFGRRELGLALRSASVKYTAPLFADRSVTLAAARSDTGWRVRAFDDAGVLAADVEMEIA